MTIASRVITTISEQLGVIDSAVSQAQSLRTELGMDSLDDIELVVALEDEFGIEIHDDDAEKWVSTADVIAYVERVTA